PDVELPLAMLVPIGVLVLPLTFVATSIVSELYGRRRAMALVWAGGFAVLAALGLAHATAETSVLAPLLALASMYVVAQLAYVLLFDTFRQRMRHRHLWLRLQLSTLPSLHDCWDTYALDL